METPTAVSQSSPRPHQQSGRITTNAVHLSVGVKQYVVSSFLFSGSPNSMLAQCASYQWQSDPEEEVFFEQDGDQLRFIIEYLRYDGCVLLCMTVPKAAFMAELAYYRIEDVDHSKITYQFGTNVQCLAHALYDICAEIRAVITSEIMDRHARLSRMISVVQTNGNELGCAHNRDRKSTRLNSSHQCLSRMPSSA